jgi:hypothetical protein
VNAPSRFEGHFEIFGTDADEVLRLVETTRPRPPEEAVREHVHWLNREGLVTEHDLAVLRAAGYRV